MAFIKAQKLTYDKDGRITGGSAAIVDTIYGDFGSYHAKHRVREKLGKVLFLSSDKKSGIFLSPLRGLVEYDATSDTFSDVDRDDMRINTPEIFPESEIHTVFGDTYLLLKFLEKSGILSVLRSVFTKDTDYERMLMHLLHGILKDGSRISCDSFIEKSFASYVLRDVPFPSLHSDTYFFSMLGEDSVKMKFFKTFVSFMQSRDPDFGRGCYVDSTPLPNDIEDNPFNALCCHGVGSSEVMTRLILVLDERSGLPVWYDIIPGNVLDVNTIMTEINNVADSLNVEIDSLVLDAGYVSKELLEVFHIGTDKTIIGRMPNRRGYPYKKLYWDLKAQIGKGKYEFVQRHHAYFGKKIPVEIFGQREYAYVYVDHNNALRRYSEYLLDHEEEYASMKDKDKDWYTVRFGYFVLLSNIDTNPAELLKEYFSRTTIEMVFKTQKEYLDLLPLSKWSDQTVRGKILSDVINTVVLLSFRKAVNEGGYSTSEIIGATQSLMCFRNRDGMVTVETPGKKVRQYYKLAGIEVPAHVDTGKYINNVLNIKV
jgi:hypothetical protein